MKAKLFLGLILLVLIPFQQATAQTFYGMTSSGGAENLGAIIKYDNATSSVVAESSMTTSIFPGANPIYAELVEYNGKFYGTTSMGGLNNVGVLFEWDPITNIYTKKMDFSTALGSTPSGSLTLKDGKFYGMTSIGGVNNRGVIFEWDPTTNVYIKKNDFVYPLGRYPSGNLTLKDGKFYGMTAYGGLGDYGVIFEWDPTTNVYTKKFTLNGHPRGSLSLKDGKFYGMASDGGNWYAGVIFEWNPVTNDYVHKFSFGFIGTVSTGTDPYGSLTLKDGKFYGMASIGGVNSLGVIFEWNPTTNIYTKKIDFSSTLGSIPRGNLTLKDGKFYGMTGSGGESDLGVIFEWDPTTNVYVKKINLDATLGSNPIGSLTLKGGKFYAMTNNGGVNNLGVIFEWNPITNVYAKKIDLSTTAGNNPYGSLTLKDSKFYGMTNKGGLNNTGVIFEWNPITNDYVKKIDFSSSLGINPYGRLVLKLDKFYGLTNAGGVNNSGVIFEWDPITNVYVNKIDLSTNLGMSPSGSLTEKDGKFYGMTLGGGVNNRGVIFEWNPITNLYVKKIEFGGTLVFGSPQGSLTLKDGKFFGMTTDGGVNNRGVIFEWDPTTNVCIKKIDFSDLLGSFPSGSLTLKDGKFYGVTDYGGTNDKGVLFEWNPVTNIYTKKIDISTTTGSKPQGSLTLKDSKFYGMTQLGGVNDKGIVFEWDPATNNCTKKADFNGANGANPLYGDLVFFDTCVVPIVYTLTGGGMYCSGTTGTAIGLDHSEIGVTYQLKQDGAAEGTPVSGTGTAISFGLQTVVGNYTVEATRTIGACTSIMSGTTVVSMNNSTTTSTTATACDTYTWSENGETYTESGVHTNTTTNASGCPNVATLNLTINKSTATGTTATACDTYTWSENGATYTESGVHTNTTTNASGCPNVATLNLTINKSTTSSESITACDSYTWAVDGNTYTASGPYTFTSTNTAGCQDVLTLNLTINPLQTWYLDADADGHYVSSIKSCTNPGSGYTLSGGVLNDCDDADLNVYQTMNLYVDADGDGYQNGTGLQSMCIGNSAPNGYSNSTLGVDCDDTNFNINPGAKEICDGIDNNCDGIVDTNPTPVISCSTPLCTGTSITLDAGSGYVLYNWSNGANTQTITVNTNTPVSVTVTNEFGCSATSAIVTPDVNLSTISAPIISLVPFDVVAYPNPFSNSFNLKVTTSSMETMEVKVYDIIGRLIEVNKATVSELNTYEIGSNFPSGVYNVIVSQGDQVKSLRMIKR